MKQILRVLGTLTRNPYIGSKTANATLAISECSDRPDLVGKTVELVCFASSNRPQYAKIAALGLQKGEVVAVDGESRLDNYNGRQSLQLVIHALKTADEYVASLEGAETAVQSLRDRRCSEAFLAALDDPLGFLEALRAFEADGPTTQDIKNDIAAMPQDVGTAKALGWKDVTERYDRSGNNPREGYTKMLPPGTDNLKHAYYFGRLDGQPYSAPCTMFAFA